MFWCDSFLGFDANATEAKRERDKFYEEIINNNVLNMKIKLQVLKRTRTLAHLSLSQYLMRTTTTTKMAEWSRTK